MERKREAIRQLSLGELWKPNAGLSKCSDATPLMPGQNRRMINTYHAHDLTWFRIHSRVILSNVYTHGFTGASLSFYIWYQFYYLFTKALRVFRCSLHGRYRTKQFMRPGSSCGGCPWGWWHQQRILRYPHGASRRPSGPRWSRSGTQPRCWCRSSSQGRAC